MGSCYEKSPNFVVNIFKYWGTWGHTGPMGWLKMKLHKTKVDPNHTWALVYFTYTRVKFDNFGEKLALACPPLFGLRAHHVLLYACTALIEIIVQSLWLLYACTVALSACTQCGRAWLEPGRWSRDCGIGVRLKNLWANQIIFSNYKY